MTDQIDAYKLGKVYLVGPGADSAAVEKLGKVYLVGPDTGTFIVEKMTKVYLIDVSGSEPTPPRRRASVRGVRI